MTYLVDLSPKFRLTRAESTRSKIPRTKETWKVKIKSTVPTTNLSALTFGWPFDKLVSAKSQRHLCKCNKCFHEGSSITYYALTRSDPSEISARFWVLRSIENRSSIEIQQKKILRIQQQCAMSPFPPFPRVSQWCWWYYGSIWYPNNPFSRSNSWKFL